MRRLRLSTVAGLGLLLLPHGASALLIDDFENGGFSVTDTTPGGGPFQSDSQASLPTISVFGGARDESTGLVSGSQSSFSLTITGGADAATATVAPGSEGRADLFYDGVANGFFSASGPLDTDLTAAGSLNRIAIEVVAVSGSAFLSLGLSDTSSIAFASFPKEVNSAGITEFLLSDWNLDVTSIDAVGLAMVGLTNGESISIGSIRVVPEPSIALLLGFGLACFALRRRLAT